MQRDFKVERTVVWYNQLAQFCLLVCCYIFLSVEVSAIIIRHDVEAKKHLSESASVPALIDLPHEGHGVLIDPSWIVTVAHTVFYDYTGKMITIGGESREISHIIYHPGHNAPPKRLFNGDAQPLMDHFFHNDDVALIRLKNPVENTKPLGIYRFNTELAETVKLYGKGRTGNGAVGEDTDSERGVLRWGENRISHVHSNWLVYRFDSPSDDSLSMESMQGSGDSGGAVIIHHQGQSYLAGLASWQMWRGNIADFKGGLYGSEAYQVRLSSYKQWIDGILVLPLVELDARRHVFAS